MTRVVLTGSSGFVGRSMRIELARRNCDVMTLTREDATLPPAAVVDRVYSFAPNVVVHLATHFAASHAADDIPILVRANVEWGTVVVEAATAAGARLVSTGSAWQHFEGASFDPVSLYAATKQALRDIIEYYVKVRGLRHTDVTLFDTYGPYDTRRKLVPLLLDAARANTTLQMSDGHQLIDLVFVDDIVRGLTDIALAEEPGAAYVLRSWKPVSVRDLVAVMESAIERTIPIEWGARPTRPREMTRDWVFGSSPDGWSPRVSLEDGLRRSWSAVSGGGA